MTLFQGGTFRSGFASGFAASFFSPGTTLGGNGAEGFTLRTTVAAVVGGTASEIGGGKFANGAISGAFVHMFNAEAHKYLKSLSTRQVVQVRKFMDRISEMDLKTFITPPINNLKYAIIQHGKDRCKKTNTKRVG